MSSWRVAAQGLTAVNLVMIRGGRHVGDRTFFPQHAEGATLDEVVPAFLVQHYLERPAPPTIIAEQGRRRSGARRGAHLAVGAPGAAGRQPRRRATRVGDHGAAERRARHRPEARAEDDAGGSPGGAAGRARACRRRCSASNASTSATRWARPRSRAASSSIGWRCRPASTVASTSTPATGGDDYAAMREALSRRVARIVAGEYPAPDLLVIDGGKGQVGVAAEVLAEQGMHATRLIGIAKGPERKPGLEEIVFPERTIAVASARRPSRPASAAADPRRGAPVRDPGAPRPARQGAQHVVAAGHRRHRRDAAQGAAGALRRARRACRRRASTTSRACPASAARWPSAFSRNCTRRSIVPRRRR